MVDRRTGRVLHAPQLGWREVRIRDGLADLTRPPVQIENAPIACALAQMWLGQRAGSEVDDFVYVTVSDGVGAGVVVNGQVVRGHDPRPQPRPSSPTSPNLAANTLACAARSRLWWRPCSRRRYWPERTRQSLPFFRPAQLDRTVSLPYLSKSVAGPGVPTDRRHKKTAEAPAAGPPAGRAGTEVPVCSFWVFTEATSKHADHQPTGPSGPAEG